MSILDFFDTFFIKNPQSLFRIFFEKFTICCPDVFKNTFLKSVRFFDSVALNFQVKALSQSYKGSKTLIVKEFSGLNEFFVSFFKESFLVGKFSYFIAGHILGRFLEHFHKKSKYFGEKIFEEILKKFHIFVDTSLKIFFIDCYGFIPGL